MRGRDLFDAAVQYVVLRHSREPEAVQGKLVISFVDGAIYGQSQEWKRIEGLDTEAVEESADNKFPILLYNEMSNESCVVANGSQLGEALENSKFTHVKPFEYPDDLPVSENAGNEAENAHDGEITNNDK